MSFLPARWNLPKLTKTIVEAAAPQEKPYTLWCSDLPGFGVYVLPTGKLTYFVDYRNKAGIRRRLTIGRHGKLTAETARKLAIATMGEVVNPARGAKRPADSHRIRRLSAEEYRQLGKALAEGHAAAEAAQGIAGTWLLALTGCRSGEIINLKWDEVDKEGSCLRLTESKEGASIRPAGQAVFEVLAQIEKKKDCPYVLVPVRGDGPFGSMARAWKRTFKRTQLTGVTPHTLRHSYASVAGDLGFTESTIAALLGHAAGSVTSRYVHHLDSVLVAAADKVAAAIHGMMTTAPNKKHEGPT